MEPFDYLEPIHRSIDECETRIDEIVRRIFSIEPHESHRAQEEYDNLAVSEKVTSTFTIKLFAIDGFDYLSADIEPSGSSWVRVSPITFSHTNFDSGYPDRRVLNPGHSPIYDYFDSQLELIPHVQPLSE